MLAYVTGSSGHARAAFLKLEKQESWKKVSRLVRNAYFRDSLTELENFIDSYAADETDEDDDDGEDEQQKMVNLLKQQMMTNLTLMNTLKQNSAFPAGEFQSAYERCQNRDEV